MTPRRSANLPRRMTEIGLLLAAGTAVGADADQVQFDRVTIIVTCIGMLLLCVLVHYEGFAMLTRVVTRMGGRRRPRMLVLILSLFMLHMLEVTLYAAAFETLSSVPRFGAIMGESSGDFFESLYFSLACYTTVGFGDLVPVGPLRLLAGSEALTGFVLITWSASFTFFEMGRLWKG